MTPVGALYVVLCVRISAHRDHPFRRIVTGVSDIVTADSEKSMGIGHVRLESVVTLARNTQGPY